MKESKSQILITGIVIGIISVLGRFSLTGWLFLFGLISIVFFGILHIIFLFQISRKYTRLTKTLKKIAWTGTITFSLIFLFQFDFGDSAGNFYVYEYITGNQDSDFEKYAFFIAIAAGIVYLGNFIIWQIKLRKIQ